MDFSSGESQKKCLNNNSNTFCSKNHYLKNVDGQFFIVQLVTFLRFVDTIVQWCKNVVI